MPIRAALRLFTYLDLSEIAGLERLKEREANKAKQRLALELTTIVHGAEEARRAAETSPGRVPGAGNCVGGHAQRDLGRAGLESHHGGVRRFRPGLLQQRGAPLIKQGGAVLNDRKIDYVEYVVTPEGPPLRRQRARGLDAAASRKPSSASSSRIGGTGLGLAVPGCRGAGGRTGPVGFLEAAVVPAGLQIALLALPALHAAAGVASLSVPARRRGPFLRLHLSELAFTLTLVFFLFACIFALNANMDYVQRFFAGGAKMRLALDTPAAAGRRRALPAAAGCGPRGLPVGARAAAGFYPGGGLPPRTRTREL